MSNKSGISIQEIQEILRRNNTLFSLEEEQRVPSANPIFMKLHGMLCKWDFHDPDSKELAVAICLLCKVAVNTKVDLDPIIKDVLKISQESTQKQTQTPEISELEVSTHDSVLDILPDTHEEPRTSVNLNARVDPLETERKQYCLSNLPHEVLEEQIQKRGRIVSLNDNLFRYLGVGQGSDLVLDLADSGNTKGVLEVLKDREMRCLSGISLSHVNLTGAHLLNFQFPRSEWVNCILEKADLATCNFNGSSLCRCDLTHAHCRHANLARIQALNVDFTGACLVGVDMRGSFFEECIFNEADFTKAKLLGVTFKYCVFSHNVEVLGTFLQEYSLYELANLDQREITFGTHY